MNHEINNAMNQPSSSRFTTSNCDIYERYKTLLLNNVSFIALASFKLTLYEPLIAPTVTTPYRLKTSTIGEKRNEGMNNEYRCT